MNDELVYINEPTEDVAIVEEVVEVIHTEIDDSTQYQATATEIKEDVVVGAVTEYNITVSEMLPVMVGADELNHATLNNREKADQHPITAITGLRGELDRIQALKTIYSDKFGVANYYKWNSGSYDEYGYFVSLVPDTSTIKICDGADIFGVTVDVAAFIGNQDKDVARDSSYALVATTGLVDVKCESDVAEGNYVVSNGHGFAEVTTSGCGYKVISVNEKQGVLYASIALGVQACTADILGKNLQHIETRVGNNETNIAAAMNTANDAYNKSVESDSVSEEAVIKALEAIAKADGAKNATDEMNKILESVNNTAVQAKAIAYGAVTEAESIRKEAYATANDALSNVNDLTTKFEPLNEWVDPATGQVGAEYIINYMDNQGLATKAEVQTVESDVEDNKSAIEQNAESITMMVSSVDKYSVGEYSQAYGLTLEQARNILKEGMVYIPTRHGELATHEECYTFVYQDKLYTFKKPLTQSMFYIWKEIDLEAETEEGIVDISGYMWAEGVGKVWFGAEQPTGSVYIYWYDGDRLCLLKDSKWVEVATLAGNVNNRITSIVRQDVDSVIAEVVNARGSGSSLSQRLSDTDATIASNAFWKKDDGAEYVATFRQVAGEGENEGASLSLVAYKTDGSGNNEEKIDVNGASFVIGTTEDGTNYIDFRADNIDLTGYVTLSDLSNEGSTNINGANIITGSIKSKDYKIGDNQEIIKGMKLDLDDNTWNSPNFKIAANGDVTMSNATLTGGVIETDDFDEAEDGTITGSQINLTYGTITTKNFQVDENGDVIANGGLIAGWDIDGNGISKGVVGLSSSDDYQAVSKSTGQSSSIRLYAGCDLDEITTESETQTQTLTFEATNCTPEIKSSINFHPLDTLNFYDVITEARVTTQTKEHIWTVRSEQEISFDTSLDNVTTSTMIDLDTGLEIGTIYTASFTVAAKPEQLDDVQCNDFYKSSVASGSNGGDIIFKISYLEKGKLSVEVQSRPYKKSSGGATVSGYQPAKTDSFLLTLTTTYSYNEQLTASASVLSDGKAILVDLIPEFSADYSVNVEYTTHTRKLPNFMVLEDGSLYSTKGEIGGWEIFTSALTGYNVGIGSSGEWAFWAGSNNASEAPFRVKHEGDVYAESFKFNEPFELTFGTGQKVHSSDDLTTILTYICRAISDVDYNFFMSEGEL